MTNLIFTGIRVRDVLERQERACKEEINVLSEDRVLQTPQEDLIQCFVEKYTVVPPEIDESDIQTDRADTKVDRRNSIYYRAGGESHVVGTKITFYVPFHGESEFLKYKPSKTNYTTPVATIEGQELLFIYKGINPDPEGMRSRFDRDLDDLKQHLAGLAKDIEQFNSSIRSKVAQDLDARCKKILRDRDLEGSLGFPLRRRSNAPATYVVPQVRRRIIPTLPPLSAEPFQLEPALGDAAYDHILSVISSMVRVIECSPQAFRNMEEEHLRQHFLVQLNGQYHGQATGETFNYKGKTDILIRAAGKNIFIAECKNWSGPSGLKKALDQLLGYTSWRDTKTALIVFNRNKEMSSVLAGIPEIINKYPCYKRDRPYESETGFQYILGHPSDPNRELTLTVLVFDVPREPR